MMVIRDEVLGSRQRCSAVWKIAWWSVAVGLLSGCVMASDDASCDCPEGEACVDGACRSTRCPLVPCADGQRCLEGYCVVDERCTQDSQCPGGRCIEGACYILECEEGESDSVPCGDCGVQERLCSQGRWVTQGQCADQGECSPGDQEAGPCGQGSRGCDEACQWGPWAELPEGSCEPGQTEQRACGNCGAMERTCLDACQWGEWSQCSQEQACTPGETRQQVCGDSDVGLCMLGQQESLCGEDCVWGDWGTCQGQRGPTEEICGDGIDQDCDGADLEIPDPYEPNNSCAEAWYVGDNPNPAAAVDLRLNFHGAQDRDDYFYFTFRDDTQNNNLREYILISLDSIPEGHKYQLFLYKDRAACVRNEPLDSSFRSNQGERFELVSWDEDRDVDDSGNYYIRVRRVEGTTCEDTGMFMRVQ